MRAVLRFVAPPALALAALIAMPGLGDAQMLDGPVPVFSGSMFPEQLATGRDGALPAVAGFVVAFDTQFDIVGQRFDGTGTPVGQRFLIEHDDVPALNTRIVAVPGGFLVVWQRSRDVHARLYAADATPLGLIFTVARMDLTGLAVNGAGTLAAIVGVPNADDPNPNEMRLRFFAPDGSSLGTEQVVGPRES